MNFYGTKDKERKLYSLQDAAMMGLAPCGGLFMPEYIPQIDMKEVIRRADISFTEMATYIAHTIFKDDIGESDIRGMVERAFNFDVPLKHIGKNLYTLELFHGPTMAFKDFGARFMGQVLSYLRGSKKLIILTATSGDTGSAVADGFYDMEGVNVVVLYPKGKVSEFQERQMSTLGKNIHTIAIDGVFDDCQTLVKDIFKYHTFCKDNNITSANSISIMRWIPQSFYYFWGYAQWIKENPIASKPVVVVPSGNYGNITAGLFAHAMGLPIKKFIAATNANCAIPQLLKSGKYTPLKTIETISNAMDVGAPSNYERLWELCNFNLDELTEIMDTRSYSDKETIEAIKHLYNEYGYISDPHSAIAYLAYRDYAEEGFWLSTAHASKFESVVKEMAGIDKKIMPSKMENLFNKKKRIINMGNNNIELGYFLTKGAYFW